MNVRRLTPKDAVEFRALRLFALRDTPSAFGSSYEEELEFSNSSIEARLTIKPDSGPFGAFKDEKLIALVTLGRGSMKKLSHRASI